MEDITGSEAALRTGLLPGEELDPLEAFLPVLPMASLFLDFSALP